MLPSERPQLRIPDELRIQPPFLTKPAKQPKKRSFTVRGLFFWVTLWAVLFAVLSYHLALGMLLISAVLAAHFLWNRSVWSAGGLAMICVVFMMLLPLESSGRNHQSVRCSNNMRQLSSALLAYENRRGSFPPAYIADAEGKPMHSWRVLILHEIGRSDLYERYDFSEPWNGPNNSKLATECPELYRCPSDWSNNSTTSYVAVVGTNTAWPGSTGAKIADFTDGLGNTILIVECRNSGINWLEPRDLDFARLPAAINPISGVGISSAHPRIAHAAFADRNVRKLRESIKPELLKPLLTRDGGEVVGPNELQRLFAEP